MKEENCRNLQAEIEDQYRKSSSVRHQMGLLYEEYDSQKRSWDETRGQLESKLELSQAAVDAAKAKLAEYEETLQVLAPEDASSSEEAVR